MFTQGAGPEHISNPDFAPFCKTKTICKNKNTTYTPSSFTVAAMLDRANEQGPTIAFILRSYKNRSVEATSPCAGVGRMVGHRIVDVPWAGHSSEQ